MKTISIAKKRKEAGQEHSNNAIFLWTVTGLVHEKAHPEILQLTWIYETYMETVGFIFVILVLALF